MSESNRFYDTMHQCPDCLDVIISRGTTDKKTCKCTAVTLIGVNLYINKLDKNWKPKTF